MKLLKWVGLIGLGIGIVLMLFSLIGFLFTGVLSSFFYELGLLLFLPLFLLICIPFFKWSKSIPIVISLIGLLLAWRSVSQTFNVLLYVLHLSCVTTCTPQQRIVGTFVTSLPWLALLLSMVWKRPKRRVGSERTHH